MSLSSVFNCLSIFNSWSLSLWIIIYVKLVTKDLFEIFSFNILFNNMTYIL